METDKIIISSVNDYMDMVKYVYQEWSESNKHLFFRGHYSETWNLLPSIMRGGYKENIVTLDFKQVSPIHFENIDICNDTNKMLVEMQHYGIPTRLLDWTIAPLTALFFACHSEHPSDVEKNSNGEIWILNPWNAYNKIREQNTTSSGISLPSTYMDINIHARSLLALNWTDNEIKQFINDKYHYNISPVEYEYSLPYIAKYGNDRIVAQRGAFTIWGKKSNSLDAQSLIYNDLNLISIKVDRNKKDSILEELNRLYINEYTVYPDYKGLAGLIRRKKGLFNV